MATRLHSNLLPAGQSAQALRVIQWTGLLTTDVGDWITVPEHTDATFQLIVDSGTTLVALSMEGSNAVGVPVAKNIGIINDSRGFANPMTWAFADATKFKTALDAPVQVRPNFSGAGDSSVTIIGTFKQNLY